MEIKGDLNVEFLGLPKMTTVEMNAYTPADNGYMIYNSELKNVFVYKNGWENMSNQNIYTSVNQVDMIDTSDINLNRRITLLGKGDFLFVESAKNMAGVENTVAGVDYILPATNPNNGIWWRTDKLDITRKLYEDVTYNNVEYGFEERKRMDIYTPILGTNLKGTVIYFHGGGWEDGDKSIVEGSHNNGIWTYNSWIDSWVAMGVCVVSVNYRFLEQGLFTLEDVVQDAQEALSFIYSNENAYKLDLDKVFLAGNSAGAYLAMLFGTGTVANFANIAGIIVLNGFASADIQYWNDSVFASYGLDFVTDFVNTGAEEKINLWWGIDYNTDYLTTAVQDREDALSIIPNITVPIPFYWHADELADLPLNYQDSRHNGNHALHIQTLRSGVMGVTDFYYVSTSAPATSPVDFVQSNL
jgi:hypothetical protein